MCVCVCVCVCVCGPGYVGSGWGRNVRVGRLKGGGGGGGIFVTYKRMTEKILSSRLTKTSMKTELIIQTGPWWNVSGDGSDDGACVIFA